MKIPTVALNSYRTVLSIAVFGFLLYQALFWAGDVSSASTQADGLFTAAQAARGGAVYARSCAECHGQNLEGKTSTALTSSRFTTKWADGKHTVDDLYFVIRTQMPYGSPGTLTNQQYIDIVAFVLQKNGYRAGGKELAPDSTSLKATTITAQSGSGRSEIESKVEVAAPSKETSGTSARPVNGKPTQTELNAAARSTDWLMSNHDYSGQRFTDLKQINRQNVASLRPVAMYQAVDTNPFHTNPVVSGGVMYITVKDSRSLTLRRAHLSELLYTESSRVEVW
jgi:mono/diheme cytochrome c family protein